MKNPKLDLYKGNVETSPDMKDVKIKKNAQVLNILKKITQKNRDIGPDNRDSLEQQ